MAASQARELQSVSLLSATHAEHPVIGRTAAVLLALGWAVLLSCAGLEAAVCEWSTGPLLQQLSGYSWQHSSVDAASVALLALLVSSIAVCSYPLVGALVSSILGVLAVVKLVYLANTAAGAQAVAVAATAAASCWSASAACGVALQRSQGARSTPRINDGRAEKLLGGEESSSANPKEVTLGRLLGVARPELPMLGVATIALFLSSAAQMVMPALVGNMIGGVIGGGDDSGYHSSKLRSLNGAVLELAIIFVVGGFFAFVRGTLFTMAGERVVARLRRRLFSTLVQQDIGFFDSNKTGELMNRLSSDTMVIQNAVTINVSMGLRFGAQVVIGLVLIFFESWKLSMMMLSIVPAIVLVAIAYGRFMKRFSKKYQEALAKASDVAQETFSGMRTVRSFAMEGREAERYTLSIDRSYKLGKSKAFAYGVFGSLIGTVGQFAVVGVLWYGGALVLKGEMNLGTLTSFLLYTLTIAACLGGLSDLFGSLMNALGASQRVFALLDSRPTRPLVGGERLDGFLGRIQLHEVSFSYPTRPESLVLDRVSLTIEPGSVVALCGSSGSGKSTVIGLIERWYEPTSGSITIDSVPLSLLDGSWWRKQVALVAQEPVLFACSIWENVAYGCLDADEAAVRAAARTANAEAFIDSFDHGFDTLVGERGVQLSGGQKQRIAIARALLVDPKVLLLDEATSALDAESEHVVQEAIDRLMSQRTTIVVAHRLSTIRSADTICVVSKGQIVEQGSHDELVDRAGIYKQLTARQAFNLNERAS